MSVNVPTNSKQKDKVCGTRDMGQCDPNYNNHGKLTGNPILGYQPEAPILRYLPW